MAHGRSKYYGFGKAILGLGIQPRVPSLRSSYTPVILHGVVSPDLAVILGTAAPYPRACDVRFRMFSLRILKYSVIYDSGSVAEQSIFSPRETLPRNRRGDGCVCAAFERRSQPGGCVHHFRAPLKTVRPINPESITDKYQSSAGSGTGVPRS